MSRDPGEPEPTDAQVEQAWRSLIAHLLDDLAEDARRRRAQRRDEPWTPHEPGE